MKKILIIFFALLILGIGITVLKGGLQIMNRVTLDLDYTDSSDSIQNPERGWYLIYRFMVNDTSEEGLSVYDTFSENYQSGDSLALVMFNLYEYREGMISDDGLRYIENVFHGLRKAGLKAIVRFVYDWDGNGIENEPDHINIVLDHMEQLKAVSNENKDIIYLTQGLFVGSYGEMNNSKFLGEEDAFTLLNKLLKCSAPSTMLAVRTPAYWRLLSQTTEPPNSFSQGSRIGLYNDGLCSSFIDLGTYSDGTESGDRTLFSKWFRSEELEFQSKLCQFVPNGGELAVESEYNDSENIQIEFPMLHISYLNRDYNMDILNKWKESEYRSSDPEDPYQGMNFYKYVQDHLGYRFVLRRVTLNKMIYKYLTPTIEIEIEIENVGFANLYYQKDVTLVLKEKDTGAKTYFPIDTDIRLWKSGEITKLEIPVSTNKLNIGKYQMYLKITDRNEVGIKLANSDIYDLQNTANAIGEFEINRISIKNIWQ